MDKYSHLDLNTLLYIKQCFEFCSDGSTHCIGYRSLCGIIDEIKERKTTPMDNAILGIL